MNCEDLMSMKQIRRGMKLVAGESGIGRNIRWIYFADCVQCLEQGFDVAQLIHGEELVIVTNASLTDDDEKIVDMIRTMQDKNIAGFAINEGQISKCVQDYCNELELPLFELSVNLHLIDLSQIVCKALVQEESNANSRERILSSILYSEGLNVEELMEQANYLGVNLSGKYRAIVMQMHEPEGLPNEKKRVDEGRQFEMRENIKKMIKNEYRAYGLGNMLILSQIGTAVMLIPADLFSRNLLVLILDNIIHKIESAYQLQVKAGVGTAYEYIEDFKKSFQEAKSTLGISKIATQEEKVYFYENLGIYSLITQITNGKFLDDYVESRIGKLIKADQMQEGELCETLETYLMHNCNANATAEALFIHRNTMRYRMDKIKRILDDDLSDMSVFLELKLAFAIRRYRENREE
ncbi:MAG: PucR family transcriptional regulator ligand-binding domain-containing protein [Lachnospiraceae bacterium]|nr:PucR family transcriptional regulator ligand-binding domain-containing protein [Lachnospiraceae bacterium]